MKCVLFFMLTTCVLLNSVQSARILVIFPMIARSHYILGNAVTRTLVEAGHDVTLVSPFVEKNPPKSGGKWTDVILEGFLKEHEESKQNFFEMGDISPLLMMPFMNMMGCTLTDSVMTHPNVVNLLNSKQKFDLVILEQFSNDAMKGIAPHFNAPLILFSTIGANGWVNPLAANPSPPSYIPDIFLSYSSHMTFFQRVHNALFSLVQELNRHILFFPAQNKLLKKNFPDGPSLDVLNYNASLIFLNSHVSTAQATPLVPSMIQIGGYHVTNNPKPLPKDLKEFLDNAKDGVVYFSMGSNLKSTQMPKEKREAILNTFSKLKQKVLWKWEDDELAGKPDNVKLGKWLPQQDILAHPNVKLFISHGGLLSTTETIYFGKPVLAIPIFGDQKVNAAQAELNGYGRSLHYNSLTEETLTAALNELLNNPKYYANAQRRSSIMQDQPIKPKDAIVFWSEYVMRHQGAPHLRVAGLDLAWYQYLLLDVVAFVGVVSFGTIAVLYLLVKKLCCKKTKTQPSTKKVKKH